MPKPKISIVVPVYNTSQYLTGCLDSLLRQTMKDIEIICVNDGSTDDSQKILDGYVKRDQRIIILRQKNMGQSSARNNGIEHAKASLIMFCDSDDTFEPTMCEVMYSAIMEHDVDIAVCGLKITYLTHHSMKASDDEYYGLKYTGKQQITDGLILSTDGAPTNKIFRKAILNRNNIEFPVGLRYEDAYFYFAYLCVSRTIYFVNQKLYNYVRRPGSTMSETWSKKDSDHSIDHLYVAIELHKYLQRNGLLNSNLELFWRMYAMYYDFAYRHAKSRGSRRSTFKISRNFVRSHITELESISQNTQSSVNALSSRTHSAKLRAKKALGKIYRRLSPSYRTRSYLISCSNDIISQNQQLLAETDAIKKYLSKAIE
jgi:glycosyltransferase involved in cell wall biosynthesis